MVVALVLSILCIVKIAMPNSKYYFEGVTEFEEGTASEIIIYDQIKLPPGIYEIQLEYKTDTDLQSICNVKDNSVFSGGLLTNGEHFYSGLGKTSFRMWLFESTESTQLTVYFSGNGSLQTGNLTIYETNQLWIFLLFLILFVALLITVILIYCLYDRKYSIAVEKKTVFFCVTLISLLASIPYLLGTSVSGADLTYHLQRIEGVKDGLLSGQFPIRLEPEWVYSHGYANGIFYCNAFLLLPAILRLLGFTVTASYNIYAITMNIATAWIAYYCFNKIFKSRYIGLVCSALYTLSIFRIYKLIITSAVGEGSALTFIPLVLYGLYRVFTENPNEEKYKSAWIPIAAGYAGLIQTHVLTCEITAIVTILICMIGIKKIFRKNTFLELAKGAVAAVLLSLWYLVPFLDYYINENVHIKYVSERTIQDRGLYPAQLVFHYWRLGNNALVGESGMQYSHALGIGLILVMGFFAYLILWLNGKWKDKDTSIVTLGKVSTVLGGLLMLMSLNIFPWDKIQNINGLTASLVSSLQFPNRFLGWGTVFLTAIFGCLLWYFSQHKKSWIYYIGIMAMLLSVTTSSMYLIDYIARDHDWFKLNNEASMGFGYISGAEYLIEGTDESQLTYRSPVAGEGSNILSYDKKYLHVKMTCINKNKEESYIELPMLHYTGYQAYDKNLKEKLVTLKGLNNVVRVILPPEFNGDIEVRFVSPIHWRLSEIVTYGFWIILIVCTVSNKCKKNNTVGDFENEKHVGKA